MSNISLEFFQPAEELREYISTYHLLRIDTEDGEPVRDQLHPEWGNVRLIFEGQVSGATLGGEPIPQPEAVIVGPTSHASPIESAYCAVLGVGLLPLGWAALIGKNASDYANRADDLASVMGKETAANIISSLRTAKTTDARAKLIDQMMLDRLGTLDFDRARILKAHAAVTNPEFRSVADLEDSLDLTPRQFELTAKTVFGFGPKKLLRSQRFARTLGQAMLAPESEWANILDLAYYDHAHFIRDFKTFMGMTPTQYMAMPHPIVSAGAVQRDSFAGAPMQVLHKPADTKDSSSP